MPALLQCITQHIQNCSCLQASLRNVCSTVRHKHSRFYTVEPCQAKSRHCLSFPFIYCIRFAATEAVCTIASPVVNKKKLRAITAAAITVWTFWGAFLPSTCLKVQHAAGLLEFSPTLKDLLTSVVLFLQIAVFWSGIFPLKAKCSADGCLKHN